MKPIIMAGGLGWSVIECGRRYGVRNLADALAKRDELAAGTWLEALQRATA